MLKRALASFMALLMLASAAPVRADAPGALRARADQLVGLFNGKADVKEMFSQTFLAQVPEAQLAAISGQVRGQNGAAQRVAAIDAKNAYSGAVTLEFERGLLSLNLALNPAAPHRIEGLLITGQEAKGETLAAVVAELKALPGTVSFAAVPLGSSTPSAPTAAHQADLPLAIGSAFKLFILAELDRSIQAGEHEWSDVVALDRLSLPSGQLQDWPKGSPLTLHTLASLMISRSDNSAADILLFTLGREKVEKMVATTGVKAPERNRPFLGTMEAFAIKTGDDALTNEWRQGDETARRALLATRFKDIDPATIDITKLTAEPRLIDSAEWFASASDLVRVMDWFRTASTPEARAILAINPGLSGSTASQFAYAGYKGGSETGVINMTLLLRAKTGQWHAVAATWNNPNAAVQNDRFAQLISRAASLLR